MRVRAVILTWGPPVLGGVALFFLARGVEVPPLLLLSLFTALAVVVQWAVFPLLQGGYQMFGAMVTLPAVVVLGPVPTALVGAFGMAVGGGLLQRRPLHSLVSNVGQRILSILLAGLVWSSLLEGRPVFDRPSQPLQADVIIPAIVASALAYALATTFFTNAFAVATRETPIWPALFANAAWQIPLTTVAGGSGLAIAFLLAGTLPGQELQSFVPLLIGGLVVLLYMLHRQLARESTEIHGAVTDLLQTLDLTELLNRFADKVERLSTPDMVWIFLYGPDEAYHPVFTRGIDAAALQPLRVGVGQSVVAWAIEHQQALRISDYTRDKRRHDETVAALSSDQVRAILATPLQAGEEPLGLLVLTKALPGHFTATQERTIMTLATQAALAVKNARLYESSRRALARVGALQQLARSAAAGADLKEIQQMLVNLAATSLGARRGILALYDEHDRVLRGVTFHNLSPDEAADWRTSPEGDDWRYRETAQAFREMRPVAVADRLELPNAPSSLPPGVSRALLATPMAVHGRAIGTILVGHPDPHRWTSEEIDLLQAIASEAAVAIENARLVRATDQQLQQMKALEAIYERINSQRDLHAIFDLIAESAKDVLGADRCGIYLYLAEEDAGRIETFARGLPDEYVRTVMRTLREGAGPVGTALRSREPMIVTDVLTDPRAEAIREAATKVGFRTLASFPMRYRDKMIGILRLYHDAVRPYGPTEVALGAAFANQAAIAVQNTRLLQEAESRAHQLGLINRIVTRVTTSLQPGDLYESLVEELHTTLNYPFVSILLTEDDHLRVMAYRGYKNFRDTFAVTEGVAGRTVRTGQAALIDDVTRDPDYLPLAPEVKQSACVPIVQNGRINGVICVEVVEKTLTQADLNLLTTLAIEVTAAIRNADLFTEVQKARDELEALYESARALSASLELPTVLESLVSVTCRRFGYDYGAILLKDLDTGDLVIRAAYGDPDAKERRIVIGQGAEGRAAQGARLVLIPDITNDPLETSAVLKTGSKLAVPLMREERVVGVFSVGVARPGALGERDKRVLTTLAGYAVVTIENAQLYEQTRYLAETDGLTGLKNHRAFRQALDQEVERSRRYGFPMSLIMIEIDKFKRYNDLYGHLRGDEVLRLVARILEREHRRNVDVVSRYGGDEFMVLLPHTVKADAGEVAERIRRGIESIPFIVEGEVASVTVSLGVACYPEDGENSNALLDAADRRMYAAKQGGGNAVMQTTS